ncbi:MAG: response regulator [Pseudomonas sp.]|uniref:hybrid sensor histidine kinase/response regulator n=1 Tax=Pseudomonas sp. TaxID=306 RepID=UPI003395C780
MILQEAGYSALIAADLSALCLEVERGAGLAVIADEALQTSNLKPLADLLERQPAWSDLPIVLLTHHGGGPERNPVAARLGELLGNVTFLERPFHPTTLVSVIRAAIRGRRRQYQARAHLEELSDGEQRLQNALKAGKLGAWQLDMPEQRLTTSASCKAHFGLQSEQPFSYQALLDCAHPADRTRLEASLRHSLASGDDLLIEYRSLWPDASEHWLDVCARALRDAEGRVSSLVGVSSNITARKLAEAELRQLNETLEAQVEQRTTELRRNEEALRQSQKMEAVGQLTGGIAHDFNNMLTGIIGSLELLRRRVASGRLNDLDSLIDLGVTSANRAAGLTHRLLAFSRRQSLDAKPVDMNKLVTSMQDLLRRTLSESIVMKICLCDDLWTAEADPNQLESALLNLVINARDAMPLGGLLTVETANRLFDEHAPDTPKDLAPGEYVVLSVSDNGIGMDPATIARAFDPFFTTKPIGQGTGLGLSMIYGFVKQSNGHVGIHSSVGQGTQVRLFLPRFRGTRLGESGIPTVAPLYARSGETVLVVEDDQAVRLLVSEVLRELGYHFVEAAEASEALPILNDASQRIDLLISDVGLPGMNGRQLAEIAQQVRPHLKVLFITGYAEHAAVRGGFLESGMQMVSKPFTLDSLTRKVREMIEE